jgi:hypothetical protein
MTMNFPMNRNNVIAAAVLLAVMLVPSISVYAAEASAGWTDDLKKARAEAKKTGKPILVDFTGSDW